MTTARRLSGLARARWYVRRARAMPLVEVPVRSKRQAHHLVDDAVWRFAPPLWRSAWEVEPTKLLRTAPTEASRGPLTAERAQGLLARDPQAASAIVELAERSLEGRFQFFGYPEATLPAPIDFSRDPFTGQCWRARHGKSINYRAAGYGDPKWIWELNRLQHLPLVALAWRLTGSDEFAEAAIAQTVQWLEQQPPGRGIAWANGFEAGIRAVSLALAYDALRAAPSMSDSRRRAILQGLHQHGRWITRDPSTHSSANNHRVGELAGLVAIGLLAPELRAAEGWEQTALEGLAAEADRQILPDGMGAEQAFGYQLFVLDLLLLVVALLDCAERSAPPSVLAALERGARALSALLGPGEPEPNFGDSDEGRAVRLDARPLRGARDVAACLAARIGHGGARALASSLDETAWLLFGQEGSDRFDRTPAAPPPGDALFPNAGLVVLRRNGVRVTVDAGPLGYLKLAAHGHADALHVTLAADGDGLVVDPGAGSYFGHPDWREEFRGTRFHATVGVDGVDQSEPGGPFLWTRHARASLRYAGGGIVVADHDGYGRLTDPVLHTRTVVVLTDGTVLVYDRLDARELHRYAQFWPFAPNLDVAEKTENTLRLSKEGRPSLAIALASSEPAALKLTRGSQEPFVGWWSPRLESAIPAWRLAWETIGSRVDLAAALCLPSADTSQADELELRPHEQGAEIEVIRSGRARAVLTVNLEDLNRPAVLTSTTAALVVEPERATP